MVENNLVAKSKPGACSRTGCFRGLTASYPAGGRDMRR